MSDFLKDMGKTAVGGVVGTVGGGVGSALTNRMFAPGNGPDEALELMNKLYPGTSPLERLQGGTSAGGAAVANQERMYKRQFASQEKIAHINAAAQKDVAKIQTGQQETMDQRKYGLIDSPLIDQTLKNMSTQDRLQSEQAITELSKRIEALANAENMNSQTQLNELRTIIEGWKQEHKDLYLAKEFSVEGMWRQFDAGNIQIELMNRAVQKAARKQIEQILELGYGSDDGNLKGSAAPWVPKYPVPSQKATPSQPRRNRSRK